MPAWFVLLARVVRGSKGGGDEYAVRTDCMDGGFLVFFCCLSLVCLFVCLLQLLLLLLIALSVYLFEQSGGATEPCCAHSILATTNYTPGHPDGPGNVWPHCVSCFVLLVCTRAAHHFSRCLRWLWSLTTVRFERLPPSHPMCRLFFWLSTAMSL